MELFLPLLKTGCLGPFCTWWAPNFFRWVLATCWTMCQTSSHACILLAKTKQMVGGIRYIKMPALNHLDIWGKWWRVRKKQKHTSFLGKSCKQNMIVSGFLQTFPKKGVCFVAKSPKHPHPPVLSFLIQGSKCLHLKIGRLIQKERKEKIISRYHHAFQGVNL